jgi:hypothetical protein
MVLYYLNDFCSVYTIVESCVRSFDAYSAEKIFCSVSFFVFAYFTMHGKIWK